jgi:benzoylformate decarboxylase
VTESKCEAALTPFRANDARRGADILIDVLRSEGVRHIFGNPGTTELPFIDALSGAPDMRYILGLQEATVVAMADGYATASKRPAFVNLHTAGGLGHGMGSLMNARVSSTPMVVTAGQQDRRHAFTDPLLSGDLVQLARPAMKWCYEVNSVAEIPTIIHRAFNDAASWPRGPVFVSLPMDVLDEYACVATGSPSNIERGSTAGGMNELAQRLNDAQPGSLAIIAGDEVAFAGACDELVRLAERLQVPVFGSSWPATNAFPTFHPLWRGNLPTNLNGIADVLAPYTCLLALGGKSMITILYEQSEAFLAGVTLIQLTQNAHEIGRTYHVDLGLVGDIGATLRAVLPLLTSPPPVASACSTAPLDEPQPAAGSFAGADGRMSPAVAAYHLIDSLPQDSLIIDESIATTKYVRKYHRTSKAERYYFLRGGALGWAMPAAVGMALAQRDEPVICIVGDGAAMYSPQALWTAAHENLNVTYVVMNNREYNVLKNFMRGQKGYRASAETSFVGMDLDRPPIHYAGLARSMGVLAERVSTPADLVDAVRKRRSDGPSLIEVEIGVE